MRLGEGSLQIKSLDILKVTQQRVQLRLKRDEFLLIEIETG